MRIAVIGLGYWGPNLLRNLDDLHQEVCIYDIDPERSHAVGKLYPRCREADSLSSILADRSIPAIVIAVPVQHHCDLIIESLDAGKHVFVEKPLCRTLQEADRIEHSLNGTVLMTGHITAYSPGIATLGRLIDSGIIGSLRSLSLIRTHCGPVYPATDVLTEVAAHDIAILIKILKKLPCSVIASGISRMGNSGADSAHLLLHWQNGVAASINVQWTSTIRRRTVVAEGTTGTLLFRFADGTEHLEFYDQAVVFDALRRGISQKDLEKITPQKKEIPLVPVEPLREELKAFLECVAGMKRPETGFEFSKKVVAVIEAARASMARYGEKVEPA